MDQINHLVESEILSPVFVRATSGTGTRKKWKMTMDGHTYTVNNTSKVMYECLIGEDQPRSVDDVAKQLPYYGVATVRAALHTLFELGLIEKFKKNAVTGVEAKRVFYVPAHKIKDIDISGFRRFEKSENFSRSSYTPKVLLPEHDPDPSLLDVPYIPFDPKSKIYQAAIEEFNGGGNLHSFERATKIADGQAFPGQGRWVYVGGDRAGKAKGQTDNTNVPSKHPDMTL